jgi:predicted TIM-barrel fold metal-dependent hydrolase
VHAGDYASVRQDIRRLLEATADRRDFDLKTLFSEPTALGPYLRSEGIDRVVLLADEGPGVSFVPTTDFICDFRDESGEPDDFFMVFGCMNPNRTGDIMAKYESDKKRGVWGYKLYPADHDFLPTTPQLMEFYRALQADGKVLMFHTGTTGQEDGIDEYGDPRLFVPILDECPDLKVVFAHAGKPLWCDIATDLARRYPNLYLDTAFIKPEKLLEYLPDLVEIADKVIFGSDWPVGVASLSGHVAQIRELGLPEDVLRKVLHDNAAKVLGLA